jgi:hypothetical protein
MRKVTDPPEFFSHPVANANESGARGVPDLSGTLFLTQVSAPPSAKAQMAQSALRVRARIDMLSGSRHTETRADA